MTALFSMEITDPAGTGGDNGTGVHRIPLLPTGKGGRSFSLSTRSWEPGDPLDRWREPLHPWDGGLFVDRLRANPRTYAKGNCDTSYPGLLLWPPKVNSVTLTNGNNPFKQVEFAGDTFLVGGRYMYYFDPATNTATEDKDFGSGKAAVDACVFNNELVVAMGESEKIHVRTAAGAWSQASDNTYAIALGVVDNKLWRAESTNRISNATTAPKTLTSWTPASPNQYYAGDSSWAVHSIIDYGGVPWVIKGDGAYAPDPNSRFKNQTPQLRRWPHADNGKGAWVGQGALWLPSASGLIRIKPGESKVYGPEKTSRPSYRFWVRGGVEWGDSMYLLVTDEGAVENTAIIKMQRDSEQYGVLEYRFYEWCRLGATTKGYCIGVNPNGTNPELVAGLGNNLRYIKLGRGGGRDADDANYEYGTSMVLETGPMAGGPDLAVVTMPVGVTVVADLSAAGESLTIAGAVDGTAYADLLDTQEGGGSAAISSTTDYQAVTRYFAANTRGQYVDVKLTGTLTSASGTGRPEIREAWLFGYSHPKTTDIITVAIPAGKGIKVNGTPIGKTHADWLDLFRDWNNRGIELSIKFQDYEESRTTRFVVRSISSAAAALGTSGARTSAFEQQAVLGPGGTTDIQSVLNVHFARVDRASAYAT